MTEIRTQKSEDRIKETVIGYWVERDEFHLFYKKVEADNCKVLQQWHTLCEKSSR